MNIFNLRFINLKKDSLKISIFISCLIHIFTIFSLFKNTIPNTKGDKYIPIELTNIDSFAGAGQSLNKEIKKDKLKINKKNLKNNRQEQVSKVKNQKEILKSIKDEEVYESEEKEINKIEKKEINMNSSDKTEIKTKRGSKFNKEENNIPEKGSVKGKSRIEITCLRCISPKYPTRALRRGAEGKPLVKVWINKLGKVIKSELIKSSGNDSIDKAALQAANKSTFYPITKDSTLKIEYELKIRK